MQTRPRFRRTSALLIFAQRGLPEWESLVAAFEKDFKSIHFALAFFEFDRSEMCVDNFSHQTEPQSDAMLVDFLWRSGSFQSFENSLPVCISNLCSGSRHHSLHGSAVRR